MQLRVVRAHHRAVVANELFAADAEVPELLSVKKTEVLAVEEALRALIVLKASKGRTWEGVNCARHLNTLASCFGRLLG